MTSILLTISLILHLFTILWIINLMQKINLKPTGTNEIEKIKSEIEDVLLAYTTEMKEENEKLVLEMKKLKVNNNQIIKRMDKTEEEITQLPKQSIQPMTDRDTVKRPYNPYTTIQQKKDTNTIPQENYQEYIPPEPEIKNETNSDILEQSDTAKILALAEQGYNAEKIAKKLSLGKGEVELVLKFYR